MKKGNTWSLASVSGKDVMLCYHKQAYAYQRDGHDIKGIRKTVKQKTLLAHFQRTGREVTLHQGLVYAVIAHLLQRIGNLPAR